MMITKWLPNDYVMDYVMHYACFCLNYLRIQFVQCNRELRKSTTVKLRNNKLQQVMGPSIIH